MKQKVFKKGIIYYLRVWLTIVKNSFNTSRVYRIEIVVRLLRTVFVVGVQLLLLQVIFGDEAKFVGWTKNEAYLIMGIWNLLNYIGWTLFGVNLIKLESKVLDGSFDYIVLKPLSSAFLSGFNDFVVSNFITAFSGVILILYYFIQEWSSLDILNVLLGFISILFGLFIWFSIYLGFASFTLRKPRNGYLDLAKELLGITKYPVDIFGESFKFVFYTFIPIAFLTTVPASVLIGRVNYYWVLGSVLVSVCIFILARMLWKFNLKGYTSSGG